MAHHKRKDASLRQIQYRLFLRPDPPGPPRILGISAGDQLVAGNLKRATCTSLAGNPLAKLEWFIGDRKLESRYFTKDNYASAELDFIPRPSDNGEEIRCVASNVALAAPMTERVRVGVHFAPSAVKIRLLPDAPRAGSNVTLVCETTSSNPPARVTWWHNGERLAASAAEETEGRFFGKVTTSELVIEATAAHDGAVVTCEAANGAADKRVHDAITLGVNRKWRIVDPSVSPLGILFASSFQSGGPRTTAGGSDDDSDDTSLPSSRRRPIPSWERGVLPRRRPLSRLVG